MKLTDKEIEALLKDMELEQPSMSFTRNVMDQVKLENAPVALKTKVDQRIIYFLTAIFITAILAVIGYAAINSNSTFSIPKLTFKVNMDLDKSTISALLKGFLFIDLIIALLYFDHILRRNSYKKSQG